MIFRQNTEIKFIVLSIAVKFVKNYWKFSYIVLSEHAQIREDLPLMATSKIYI